jgi:hypothetical protein
MIVYYIIVNIYYYCKYSISWTRLKYQPIFATIYQYLYITFSPQKPTLTFQFLKCIQKMHPEMRNEKQKSVIAVIREAKNLTTNEHINIK